MSVSAFDHWKKMNRSKNDFVNLHTEVRNYKAKFSNPQHRK